MTQVKLLKKSKKFGRALKSAMSFEEYLELIDSLLEDGKTTGPDQSESMVQYGILNRHRMRRLGKTVRVDARVSEAARALDKRLVWLIITEGWCGDAAQNLPVIEKIAAESDSITTRYILRDENLDLMDQYLTNGSRSIPILICIDGNTDEELGVWGSRPAAAKAYFESMRDAGLAKPEMSENIQRWYIKDKEASIQGEFLDLLEGWSSQ